MFDKHRLLLLSLLFGSLAACAAWTTSPFGTIHLEAAEPPLDAETRAERALAAPEDPSPTSTAVSSPAQAPNILELILKGGWLMLPIVLMSLLVVAAAAERTLALRRGRVAPRRFLQRLDDLAAHPQGPDLRAIERCCWESPSAAARVVQAVLPHVGRPLAEIEHALQDAVRREAEQLYRPVRTLNLAAAVTPLLGLLGTVWGMIQAFYRTANLPVGVNKAEALAEGIYVALVTTAGGLVVAIPAAVLAHWFEGRIQKMLGDVDARVARWLPALATAAGRPADQHTEVEPSPTVTQD